MAQPLVEVWRGKLAECIHRGSIAVVNKEGDLLYKKGDAFTITYMRSAAKFFQAMNVVLSGAANHFGFSDAEYAITCGSHYAEPFHLQTVKSILKKAGLTQNAIRGGVVTSLKWDYALELARRHEQLTPLHSDCSGKHAGMLAAAAFQQHNLDDYLNPQHPVQQDILSHIAYMTKYPRKSIRTGIDGCSAPVHGLPLYHMALGYARFASPEHLKPAYANAANILYRAAGKHPEMLAGTDGFCAELTRESKGKLIGKIGAEGVYCIGVKSEGIGIAVKIESGNMHIIPPVVMKILEDLGILAPEEQDALKAFRKLPNKNDAGTQVGTITPVFELEELR